MNDYEQKRADRAERLRARAERKAGEAQALEKRATTMASAIPFGQPILIGHHSEKRDRNYRGRIRSTFQRAHEARQEAAELARRADSAEANRAISSDDPDAIEKLRARVAELEGARDQMKAVNRLIRRKDARAALAAAGYSEKTIEEVLTPDPMGRIGFPSYVFQNSGNNIRRLRARIADLERRETRAAPEPETHGDVTIEEAENRVRITFPGKPSEAIRRELKSYGFRWTPSLGVWQRHASVNAWWAARSIVTKAQASQGAA
jgi:Rad3-related DNA helicase